MSWEGLRCGLILVKLLANRPKDRVDVSDILFVQGTLDEAYMRRWAATLGIAVELEDALSAGRD